MFNWTPFRTSWVVLCYWFTCMIISSIILILINKLPYFGWWCINYIIHDLPSTLPQMCYVPCLKVTHDILVLHPWYTSTVICMCVRSRVCEIILCKNRRFYFFLAYDKCLLTRFQSSLDWTSFLVLDYVILEQFYITIWILVYSKRVKVNLQVYCLM